ncbi:MAG: AI-2E family transporter [Sphingobacteriales bacterium]|nr:AI-2E family transporter [Sphingobacteriales bacterium]
MITDSTAFLKKLLVIFLVVSGLYLAEEFLIPLSLGALLATFFLPFCKWMEEKKIPRAIAVFTCLVLLLSVFYSLVALIGWQVSKLTGDLSFLKQKAIDAFDATQLFIFDHFGISAKAQSQLLKDQQSSFTGYLEKFANSMAAVFTGFIITMVYFILLLYYRNHIKKFMLKLVPASKQVEAEHIIYSAANVSTQYLQGLSKMILCLWIMYTIGFSIAGVENALFFAILCGLLEIVPFIGNLTGTTITVLVAAAHGASYAMMGGIILTYGIVQFIQGWVLEPIILGPNVKINPLFTILALVVGEIIWGIPGIVLAIPITAIFKIVCDHIEPLKPYGFLIGALGTAKTETHFIKKIKNWFKKI